MTWRTIKLTSNKNYLELLNQGVESIHLSVFRVTNNSEFGESWNQWEAILDEDSLEATQFFDILEILEGITRRKIDIGVAEMYWSAEDKCFHLSETWYLKENMVGTMTAKGQFTDIRWYYIKEIVIITRSFHDRIYIVSMGMNTKFKVDSHFSNA